MTIHFQPLWVKMAPKFGIAHALAFGVNLFAVDKLVLIVAMQLGPWMASEIPDLVKKEIISHNGKGPVIVNRNDIARVAGE